MINIKYGLMLNRFYLARCRMCSRESWDWIQHKFRRWWWRYWQVHY